jgi:hypothetical protein
MCRPTDKSDYQPTIAATPEGWADPCSPLKPKLLSARSRHSRLRHTPQQPSAAQHDHRAEQGIAAVSRHPRSLNPIESLNDPDRADKHQYYSADEPYPEHSRSPFETRRPLALADHRLDAGLVILDMANQHPLNDRTDAGYAA